MTNVALLSLKQQGTEPFSSLFYSFIFNLKMSEKTHFIINIIFSNDLF